MGNKSKQSMKDKKKASSRKDIRKNLRKEKKAKKNEYFKNKKNVKNAGNISGVNNGGPDLNTNKKQNMNDKTKLGAQVKSKSQKPPPPKINAKKEPSFMDERNKMHREEVKEKSKLESGMRKMRKKVLLEANKFEDKQIKRLEKQLKLNKRKSKTIPKSFADEGLDFLLEVCDNNKIFDAGSAEMKLQEFGSDFEDDFALVTGNGKRKLKHNENVSQKKKKVLPSKSKNDFKETNNSIGDSCSGGEFEESLDDEDSEVDSDIGDESGSGDDDNLDIEHSDSDELNDTDMNNLGETVGNERVCEKDESEDTEDSIDDYDDDDDGDDDDEGNIKDGNFDKDDSSSFGGNSDSANESEDEKSSSMKKKSQNGTWEDIYGRLRDKDGNIIQPQEKGKYVPPHLRAQQLGQDAKRAEELSRLKRQLKGLVNRLAESNIHSITNQIDELYMRNSRNDMNDSLLSLLTEALVQPVLSAERLVMEQALLIATLHANVGMEVGAHFLQTFVQKFDAMYKEGQAVENKRIDNVLLILCHMYNFKVFHAVLMYNLLDQLTAQFSEKEVELVLLVLRSVGFSLRRDNPLALKDLILRLQKKASESTHLRDNPRVRFMLDTLLAVKNNNMAKIPQYDHSLSEHLKKLLKALVRKGKYVTELKITLDDLLKAEERGRWWIVGSAWSGAPSTDPAAATDAPHEAQFSQTLLELARKQRMNTDTRRNIFCVLMSAEDYLDAYEKLLRLGLKAGQEQEIVHVMVHCLLQERRYNPYYAHLAAHSCQTDRKHQMSIQYHLWDKLKELSSLSTTQITHLAKFLAHLLLEKALPISVLKVMQFSEMDKGSVRLLRQVLLSVLLSESAEMVATVFARVARPDKLRMFRESLRLFLHHFVLRNVADLPEDQADLLRERVTLAETALTTSDTSRLKL